jgi:sugar lactone lactonase YvrE
MCRCLYVVDPATNLYTIDPATASPRTVGAVGSANVTDVAFHGPTLYGVSFSQLLRIDPDTAGGTPIGPIGYTTNGLAVATDGTIYAGTTAGELITVNPVTGAGTLVGSFGGGMTSSGDLVLDSNDVLYAALDQGGTVVLTSVDRATGAATVIGPTGQPSVYGLAFLCCHLFGTTERGELLHINAASGKATIVGRNRLTQWGMAARPCCWS